MHNSLKAFQANIDRVRGPFIRAPTGDTASNASNGNSPGHSPLHNSSATSAANGPKIVAENSAGGDEFHHNAMLSGSSCERQDSETSNCSLEVASIVRYFKECLDIGHCLFHWKKMYSVTYSHITMGDET